MADDAPSSWREEALLALRCQQYQQIGLSSGKWNFQDREQENAVEEEKKLQGYLARSVKFQ